MSQPAIINQSYMAAAEPSWAKRITDWQLLGILNLSALLTPKIFLSDVHLGDNPHVFNSYLNRSDSKLYGQIIGLCKAGLIYPLLRDRTIRPQHSNADFTVGSFEDVYKSWRQLDPSQAFINQDTSDARLRFFKSLDSELPASSTLRYDYAGVKTKFMAKVREASGSARRTWFISTLDALSADQRKEYEAILHQEWFSLSDIYNFLQSINQPDNGLSALYAHGLLNESAYSETVNCDLTGFDTEEAFVQERIWRPDPVSKTSMDRKFLKLEEHADGSFESPSLSLLSLLTPDQIVEIRAIGNSYFDFAVHKQRTVSLKDEDFQKEFLYHASNYWQSICNFIAERHPGAAKRPRRLVLFLGQLPAPLSTISEEAFRFTLSLGGNLALKAGPADLKLGADLKTAVTRLVNFVFLADVQEMTQLRKLLPFGVWSRKPPSGTEAA
jgi:hypothetical protein